MNVEPAATRISAPHGSAIGSGSIPASKRFGGRFWLTVAGVVVALGVLAGVVNSRSLVERWLGSREAGGTYHVVKRGTLSVTLQEEGELKPVRTTEIKVGVPGDVTIQYIVEESTYVRAGDLLVRLSARDLADRIETERIELQSVTSALEEARNNLAIVEADNRTKLSKAQTDLRIAELDLEKYDKGDFEQARRQIEINRKQTEIELERRQDDLVKNERLREREFVSQSVIDEIRAQIEKAELTIQKFDLDLRILAEYDRTMNLLRRETTLRTAQEELEQEKKRGENRLLAAQTRVNEQEQKVRLRQDRLARLEEQLRNTEIRAPVDGLVQYGDSGGMFRWGGNRIAVGERVGEGQVLMTLPDTTSMKAVTRVHETDRHKIREGLRCLVRVPAVPGTTLTGRLTKIAQFADSGRSWWNPELKEHETEIALDPTDAPLSPGDTALIEVLIEEVPNVLTVPVQAVHVRGAKRYVFVRRGAVEPVEIQTGRSSSTLIEVTSGLKEGDGVLLAPGEELLAKLPAAREGALAAQPRPKGPRRAGGAAPSTQRAAATQSTDTAPAATQPTSTQQVPTQPDEDEDDQTESGDE